MNIVWLKTDALDIFWSNDFVTQIWISKTALLFKTAYFLSKIWMSYTLEIIQPVQPKAEIWKRKILIKNDQAYQNYLSVKKWV